MNRSLVILTVTLMATAVSLSQTIDAKLKSADNFVLSDSAIAAGIDGALRVSFAIDKSGSVRDVHILTGPAWPCDKNPNEELKAVQKAVKDHIAAMKFEPAMKDGRPVEARGWLDFKIGKAFAETTKAEAKKMGTERQIVHGPLRDLAIDIPDPVYPVHGAYGPSGEVTVRIVIGENGKIVLAGVESGNPIFHAAARIAACKAKFKPILENGQPVRFTGFIVYEFTPPGLRQRDFYPPQ
ncbi:MAG TPA: TonB family protein [Pyrinomonadaceae bacterium]|nr:TonB family protein [Pyrinomonadaceae bacterium]